MTDPTKCDHIDYDDYFEKYRDCGMTGEEHRHRTFTNQQCTRARPRDPARPGCEHTGCVSGLSEPGAQRLERIQ